METITNLLVQWRDGSKAAFAELMERVYPKLRRLAELQLSQERPGHTLEPRALVHEAYMRLARQEQVAWSNRNQFYALASTMMRRVLVDHARARQRAKRCGIQVSVHGGDAITSGVGVEVIALDRALDKLEAEGFSLEHEVVQLRFFGGLTIAETAEHLAVGHATVERAWVFARTWLYHELTQHGEKTEGHGT